MQEKTMYWLDLADDDLKVAKTMLNNAHYLHMGFLCHLTIEKALKAAIEHTTNEIPPKIHDLRKLAKQGGIFDKLSAKQSKLLDALMPLQIEARYPEYKEKIAQTLSKDVCEKFLAETEELLCWIKQLLGK